MAGINLSQSLQEKEAHARWSFFDKGFFISFSIFLVAAITYGGVFWYQTSLEKKVTGLQNQITEKQARLKGSEVERVVDFRERLDMIGKNLDSQPDPTDLFSVLEGSVIPSIRLTRYRENWVDRTVEIDGVTDNFKFLAQEMLALKKNEGFSKVAVSKVEFKDEGKLEFSLVIDRTKEETTKTSL